MGGTPNAHFITDCFDFYSKLELPPPNVLIETGTYYGKGAAFFSNYFKKVHTIELSFNWYNKSSELLSKIKNIECHLGNSVDILPALLQQYNQPVAFYLDAHYSGGDTTLGDKEVPLFEELTLIRERNHKDLIIIDDLRLFGGKGICGHENHRYYPLMNYDWTSITVEKILNLFHNGNLTFSFTKDDRLIIIANLSNQEVNSLHYTLKNYGGRK